MSARSCHHAHIQVMMAPLVVTISDDCQWQMDGPAVPRSFQALDLWWSARLIPVPVGADFP
ncbi:hypothetical protein ACFTZK_01800 [Streptomyces decoyicus]|uniref:hypothetical protein n=1 Tax=Streptomyces decoyicus TaxID=249567 RepID=UPI00362E9169